MKAVRIHDYGGTDVLLYEDAPRPEPGEGEVLVRVHATTVDPFDCAVRAGYLSSYFDYSFPLILGTDVSGVIEEVGDGVEDFAPGDEVYARAGVYRDGANAEYVAVAASDVADKPRSLDYVHAAALPHVVLTAWQALIEEARLEPGQTVLVHGAAGGVGHVAVQLAHLHGARVVGTASINLELLQELDVEEEINYSEAPFEDVVGAVDVVLDTVGGDTQERSWSLLKPGGILLSTVQAPSEEKAAHGVRQRMIATWPPIGPTLTEVAELVDHGEIRPVVSLVLPLEDIRKAHTQIEGRHTRGKIALRVVP
jgi:NADPH:quinone reductase-like Zn-dependent oxidoreductase